MDGFAESEKSESETGFGFVKSNTASAGCDIGVFIGYVFSTCANTGRYGPTQHQCDLVYRGQGHVKVIDDSGELPAGTQLWTVPVDGLYTYVYAW